MTVVDIKYNEFFVKPVKPLCYKFLLAPFRLDHAPHPVAFQHYKPVTVFSHNFGNKI